MNLDSLLSRDIGRVKQLVIVLGVLSLLLFELAKYFFFDAPVATILLDTAVGLLLILMLTLAVDRLGERLQRQLLHEIEQRNLIENQLRLRSSALEAAANGIVITDRQGKIIWVNPAFVALTGYKESEVVGKNPSVLRSGRHEEAFYHNMWQTILSGQAWHGEVINRRKDGRLYTEEQTITPVLDEEGRVSHFIAIKLDITPRKQAEASLRQFTERLEAMHAIDQAILSRRALQEMIPNALLRLQQIVPWTHASVVLLGLSPSETLTLTLDEEGSVMTTSGAAGRFDDEQALHHARQNQVQYVPDLRQTAVPVSETLQAASVVAYLNVPLMIQADELLGLLNLGADVPAAFTEEHVAIAREIADSLAIAILQNRLYEAERRQREKAEVLQETGAALSSTLDFDQVLRLMVDQIVRVVPCDAANLIMIHGNFARLVHSTGYDKYGVKVATKVANLVFEVDKTPNLVQLLQTKQPLIINDVYQYPGWLHDKGVSHTRAWVGVPVFLQDETTAVFALSKNQPDYYHEGHVELLQAFAAQAALALDNAYLYEQLRAHATQLEDRVAERTYELAEANKRLTELDRLKSKFISDVSHELRTPITNMNVYLDLMEKGKAEKRERYLQILRQETARLTQLIENIFDESHQTSHLHQTQYTLVDLNHIVGEVSASHHSQIEARNLKLVCTLDPELPAVFGEPSQLARVLTNLLNNAINYTPSGSIHIRTFRSEDSIHLQVEDTGVGIDPEDLPHLFDRFYRGRNASQSTIPGTGLGLGVVQEIVGLHHGEISAQSGAAGGALFDVRLPVRMPLANI
ncbi:MAG: GAF domain-containing protein [Ardenticatenaceae bacterium]|nr:GAF domain-containing protein [Ardenticatenaceae bacterium]MCB8988008.1 GAF domain-containing protein [Ardenticatenaceae bacterium]